MNPLTRHPHSVGETYWEHQGKALGFCFGCLSAAFMAFTHAFLPFLFEHGASTKIKQMNDELQARVTK